ncbi:MAG: hypothetical protein SGARI_002248 [Bacillariaceae sp.]
MVDTNLTESMLARLAKIKDKYKEQGDENDPTRLVSSWKGAPEEEKNELVKIVTDPDMGGKMSASKVKEEYPKFRIYTTKCLQTAIGNARTKAREAIKKREERRR